jgi:plastocyanin
MNKLVNGKRWVVALLVALVMSVSPLAPTIAHAATGWQVGVGAENKDMAIQVAYFFSREITVNVGDTVTWNFQTGEPHSVNFLAGTGSGGPIDSGLQTKGAPPFSLTFNLAGDYIYGCDLHSTMSGVVHVKSTGSAYPHDQKYYDRQSKVQQMRLLDEGFALRDKGFAAAEQDETKQAITAGIGAVHETGAIFVLRFLKQTMNVKVGETVTWSNLDPEAPHTITFNLDYPNPFDSLFPVGLDVLGLPGHATMNATTQPVNSGFLWAAPFPGLPPGTNRGTTFQVKFTQAGTYNYKCELHDGLGMIGTIKVKP